MVVRWRSRGRGKAQHIDENASKLVAHVVFPGRSAPVRLRKILLWRFSDLSGKKEKVYVLTI
ncbi:hypothetical protein F8C56_15985, partial [Salmonella enterica]|nr:hypothetical protein [Salmonella enterica]